MEQRGGRDLTGSPKLLVGKRWANYPGHQSLKRVWANKLLHVINIWALKLLVSGLVSIFYVLNTVSVIFAVFFIIDVVLHLKPRLQGIGSKWDRIHLDLIHFLEAFTRDRIQNCWRLHGIGSMWIL